MVTTLSVAPGRAAEFESFFRDNLPAFREANVIFGVYQRTLGGPSAWLIVENLRNFAGLGRPGIKRGGTHVAVAARERKKRYSSIEHHQDEKRAIVNAENAPMTLPANGAPHRARCRSFSI